MATYFGPSGITSNAGGPAALWLRTAAATCPGSGSQTVKELSSYIRYTSGNTRLALYDTSGNLICQGTGEVAIGNTAGWQGHLVQSGITPNPTTITGGTSYKIAITVDVAGVVAYYVAGAGGQDYGLGDYTGGFPSTLGAGSDPGNVFAIRCGVDPTYVSIPIAMADFRRYIG